MVRPCFLVADPEHAASISTRKLVIETAKLNVITVYSSPELLETLDRFPGLDGVVINASMQDPTCAEVVRRIKAAHPKVPIVVVGADREPCEADYALTTYNPADLLQVLKSIEPRRVEQIEKHDEDLARKEL